MHVNQKIVGGRSSFSVGLKWNRTYIGLVLHAADDVEKEERILLSGLSSSGGSGGVLGILHSEIGMSCVEVIERSL